MGGRTCEGGERRGGEREGGRGGERRGEERGGVREGGREINQMRGTRGSFTGRFPITLLSDTTFPIS